MTDKKLKSKIALTYNTGLQQTATSVITGKILNVAYSGKFDRIAVSYGYFNSAGEQIAQSAWQIETPEEINTLMKSIDPLLPAPVGEAEDTMIKFYTGFMLVATESWNTDISDWEIVDDIV